MAKKPKKPSKARTVGVRVDQENNGERFWDNVRENLSSAPAFARTWLRSTDVVEELTLTPASAIALLEWCESVVGWADPSGSAAPRPLIFDGFTASDAKTSDAVFRYRMALGFPVSARKPKGDPEVTDPEELATVAREALRTAYLAAAAYRDGCHAGGCRVCYGAGEVYDVGEVKHIVVGRCLACKGRGVQDCSVEGCKKC